ncbi:unnamed protein product, partial [Polarella glacialis]
WPPKSLPSSLVSVAEFGQYFARSLHLRGELPQRSVRSVVASLSTLSAARSARIETAQRSSTQVESLLGSTAGSLADGRQPFPKSSESCGLKFGRALDLSRVDRSLLTFLSPSPWVHGDGDGRSRTVNLLLRSQNKGICENGTCRWMCPAKPRRTCLEELPSCASIPSAKTASCANLTALLVDGQRLLSSFRILHGSDRGSNCWVVTPQVQLMVGSCKTETIDAGRSGAGGVPDALAVVQFVLATGISSGGAGARLPEQSTAVGSLFAAASLATDLGGCRPLAMPAAGTSYVVALQRSSQCQTSNGPNVHQKCASSADSLLPRLTIPVPGGRCRMSTARSFRHWHVFLARSSVIGVQTRGCSDLGALKYCMWGTARLAGPYLSELRSFGLHLRPTVCVQQELLFALSSRQSSAELSLHAEGIPAFLLRSLNRRSAFSLGGAAQVGAYFEEGVSPMAVFVVALASLATARVGRLGAAQMSRVARNPSEVVEFATSISKWQRAAAGRATGVGRAPLVVLGTSRVVHTAYLSLSRALCCSAAARNRSAACDFGSNLSLAALQTIRSPSLATLPPSRINTTLGEADNSSARRTLPHVHCAQLSALACLLGTVLSDRSPNEGMQRLGRPQVLHVGYRPTCRPLLVRAEEFWSPSATDSLCAAGVTLRAKQQTIQCRTLFARRGHPCVFAAITNRSSAFSLGGAAQVGAYFEQGVSPMAVFVAALASLATARVGRLGAAQMRRVAQNPSEVVEFATSISKWQRAAAGRATGVGRPGLCSPTAFTEFCLISATSLVQTLYMTAILAPSPLRFVFEAGQSCSSFPRVVQLRPGSCQQQNRVAAQELAITLALIQDLGQQIVDHLAVGRVAAQELAITLALIQDLGQQIVDRLAVGRALSPPEPWNFTRVPRRDFVAQLPRQIAVAAQELAITFALIQDLGQQIVDHFAVGRALVQFVARY